MEKEKSKYEEAERIARVQEQRYVLEFNGSGFETKYPKHVLKDRLSKKEFKEVVTYVNDGWSGWCKEYDEWKENSMTWKNACLCCLPFVLMKEEKLKKKQANLIKENIKYLNSKNVELEDRGVVWGIDLNGKFLDILLFSTDPDSPRKYEAVTRALSQAGRGILT